MGRVGAPHGVRGAIKVRPESAALADHADWWLRPQGGDAWTAHHVLDVRVQGEWLVAAVAGVESREAAGALRGADVGVPRALLPALAEGEHYEVDLVGFAVVNREGIALGALREFVESGAHPIARVVAGDGVERLIPWVAQYIDGVDTTARRVDVDWPADE